jgi:hypothetical protein
VATSNAFAAFLVRATDRLNLIRLVPAQGEVGHRVRFSVAVIEFPFAGVREKHRPSAI